MYSCSVHTDNQEYGKELSMELYNLLQAGEPILGNKIQDVLEAIQKIRLRPWEEKSPIEKWDCIAENLPGDIAGYWKTQLSRIVSSRVYGDTLEALCGFNSYIYPHLDRNVIAQDFSEKMLRRYEYPSRQRVLFDIDGLPKKRLEFMEQSFDNIFFIKGYKYVQSPIEMFREWLRLLKPFGTLSFIETTTAGYYDTLLREIDPHICRKELDFAGFSRITIETLPFKDRPDEEVFLFSAQK